MRGRVIFSIVFSLILIGGAFAYRFTSLHKVNSQGVEVAKNMIFDNSELQSFLDYSTTTNINTNQKEEVLSKTDLVGRGLLSDYVNLASAGANDPESVTAIANKYIDKIPQLIEPKTLSIGNLKIVPDSKENFRTFSTSFWKLIILHENEVLDTYNKHNKSLSTSYTTMMKEVSVKYSDLEKKLEMLPVPVSLSNDYLKLINIELSNIASSQAVGYTDDDPAKAFSGLINITNNLDLEISALKRIQEILKSNGL